MINSRRIEDLHPIVANLCNLFIQKSFENNIEVLITATYRDIESQNDIYAQGRTKSGKIVTNAKGGDSYHNFRVAFDFVPMKDHICQWHDISLFKKCGIIGESLGLEWGGNWKTFKDYPHFQYTQGLTLADFRSGKTL